MDIRKASMDIMTREFKWAIELAIKNHPTMIDVRILRGNVVTAFDYARRVLIRSRKIGIGRYSADQVRKLKPPLRVSYNDQGLTFSGIRRKQVVSEHWNSYKPPFDVLPAQDVRWTTLAVDPSSEEVFSFADMLVRGVLECPVELRTSLTPLEVERAVDLNIGQIHVFRCGRNIMLWPRRSSSVENAVPVHKRWPKKKKAEAGVTA